MTRSRIAAARRVAVVQEEWANAIAQTVPGAISSDDEYEDARAQLCLVQERMNAFAAQRAAIAECSDGSVGTLFRSPRLTLERAEAAYLLLILNYEATQGHETWERQVLHVADLERRQTMRPAAAGRPETRGRDRRPVYGRSSEADGYPGTSESEGQHHR